MRPSELPEYVKAQQAARETKIPLTTLRKAHFSGELPALRLGREGSRRQAWYFKRSDLIQFLERHTETRPPKKQTTPRIHVA